MYPETIYPKTKQVWQLISKFDFLNDFYLAGGTALAVLVGHRKSIDLDFFSEKKVNPDIILQKISNLKPNIINISEGTLDVIIDDVKVSFLEYKYPILENLIEFDNIELASIKDIACMKLTAVASRGSKKDFLDLYFILQQFSLRELIEFFEKKYIGHNYNLSHILKSLIYFADAEADPMPDLVDKIKWEEVKSKIQNVVSEYLLD